VLPRLTCVAALVVLLSILTVPVRAADVDRAVAGGHWYSQAARPGELGFALVDDEQARFWSEFQRLGGVGALGYPVSVRFRMDGFVVQATQRVLMQWRPESGSVAYVNVFDRLHDLGHDEWLLAVRQTPRPGGFDDRGKAWDDVVRTRLAALDERPAIRAAYFAVVGDPVQANGLPTSPPTDMGNHLALRAQRVVFQEWKEDVPWARKGQVTVALGGDIAKELGVLPPDAVAPVPPTADARIVGQETAAPLPSAAPPAALNGSVGPIRTDPAELAPLAAEVGAGARLIEDGRTDTRTLAQGRPDPAAYAARLEQLGYVAGQRRGFVRDAPDDPSPTRRRIVASEVGLFRSPEAALAFWRLDAVDGWSAREPAIRLDPLPAPGVGDESVAFRVVSGDVAARGYMLLFRRANAVAFVSVLSQVSLPTLDETAQLARALDERLVRAMQS
jgi:hypothetical protein